MTFPRLFVSLLLSLASLPAFSQSGQSVAAVVNGEIITQHDVEERTKLTLLTSGLPDTPEMRANVVGTLLRRLIDEDLKIQAATKARMPISANEVTARIESIEQQNHLPAGGLAKLLAGKGVEMEALRQQVRGDIAWAKLVQQVLSRKVHVSDNAVTTRLEAIKANLGKPEYRVGELFLSFDDAKSEAEVRDLAERLAGQMRQGAPFGAIARQFNQGGAKDGDLGWVSEGMLDDELLTAMAGLQVNGVTQPIRTTDGYYILTLLEQRKVGEGWGSGATVDLMIIDLNSIATASQAERDLQMQHLREALAPAANCDDLTRLAKRIPSASANAPETLPETQIPSQTAALIKDLAPGKVSEPIDTAKGRRFFAVCGRGAGNSEKLPSADDIRRQMEDQQLELVSRHYMIDLHSDAVIDIRK
jgi:peptidyl-prolyl cis-trans isomerase SurA